MGGRRATHATGSPADARDDALFGGGIAGDFPICVVPMIHQDLRRDDVPLWA